jgi:hypothetical protein
MGGHTRRKLVSDSQSSQEDMTYDDYKLHVKMINKHKVEKYVTLIYLEIFNASFDASNCERYITVTSITESE